MAKQTPTTPARAGRQRAVAPPTIFAPPIPVLPQTPKELADHAKLMRQMDEAIAILIQRNLDNAVALAQQAARRQGPLVEHFGELGRRFQHLLQAPPKPDLHIIKGGAA